VNLALGRASSEDVILSNPKNVIYKAKESNNKLG
jgi:hypothetical protein